MALTVEFVKLTHHKQQVKLSETGLAIIDYCSGSYEERIQQEVR